MPMYHFPFNMFVMHTACLTPSSCPLHLTSTQCEKSAESILQRRTMFMTKITAWPRYPAVRWVKGISSLWTVSQRIIQPSRRIRTKRKVAIFSRAVVLYLMEFLGS